MRSAAQKVFTLRATALCLTGILAASALAYAPFAFQKELPAGKSKTTLLSFSFSPDGTRIAYTKADFLSMMDATGKPDRTKKLGAQNFETWIADADGSNAQKMNIGSLSPVWSRDNKTVYFLKFGPENKDIYAYDIASKTEKALGLNQKVGAFDCSPVDGRIVFMAQLEPRRGEDFVCDADGSNVKQITFGDKGSAYDPQWSADGRSIVFYREVGDFKDQIYVMDEDGGNLRHISDSGTHNFYPSFGPDGTISYTTSPDGRTMASVVNICDKDGKALKTFPYKSARMKWSKDGKRAIFTVGGMMTTCLYICDADGGSPKIVSE